MAYKYLSPDELFDVRRKAIRSTIGKKNLADLFGAASARTQAGEDALRAIDEDDEPSFGDRFKGALGGAIDVLSRPGRAVLEVGRGTSLLKGKIGGGGNALKVLTGNADEIQGGEANLRSAMSIDPNAGGRPAGALDTIGSALVDPFSWVTLGTGGAAKAGLTAVARGAGDDVAQAIRQGGVRAGDEVLASRSALQTTVPGLDPAARAAIGQADPRLASRLADAFPRRAEEVAGARSVREVLEGAADTGLTNRNLDDVVSRQLRTLDRRGRGGIGFAGLQTGVGTGFGSGAAQAFRPLHRLLSPTAAVGDEFGQVGRDAVDAAIHTGANVRRVAHKELADQFSETGALDDAVKDRVRKAMADDLDQLGGGRLVSGEAKDGWVKLAEDQYVPKVVKEALDQAIRKPPSDALRAFDSATSVLKRYTTLGPLNAIPHVSRNIISNKMFAGMFGGVTDPRLYEESWRLREGLKAAQKADDLSPAGVARALGVDEGDMSVRRALAMHDQQLVGRGSAAVDDIGQEGRKPLPGTKWASQVNEFDEEMTRGAVFLKGLDEGLDPRLAAKKSRHAMLDYSDEGLTQFERERLQRVVFFYKFPRRAVPAGMEFMVRYPGAAGAISEAGFGVATGARNEYNEKIGPYLDTPLEATVGTLFELAADPTGMVNPVLREAASGLSGNGVDFAKALPPLGQAKRMFEAAGEDEAPWDREGGFSRGAPGPFGVGAFAGMREGKDYAKTRWEEDRDERIIERGEPSDLDKLIELAEAEGVVNPYKMSKGKLARALKEKGLTSADIGAILKGS